MAVHMFAIFCALIYAASCYQPTMKKQTKPLHELLEMSWRKSGENWEAHWQELYSYFDDTDKDTLVEYWRDFARRRSLLFKDEIFNGAYLVMGGALGTDGFLDFADKAAALPDEVFDKIVQNPDAMADYRILEEPADQMFSDIFAVLYDVRIAAEEGTFALFDLGLEEAEGIADWERVGNVLVKDQEGIDRLKEKYKHVLEGMSTGGVVRGSRRK